MTSPILTITRLAMGPVIAVLILWAASELYSDRLLAGFIYALCCLLLMVTLGLNWLAEKKHAASEQRPAFERTVDGVLLTCLLVPLAYSSLPLSLVAAALVILIANWIGAYVRNPSAAETELGGWRTAAEMAGVVAFLGFQSAAILFAPQSIVLGLDWAARILLWAAAALALISGGLYVATALRRA